MASGARVPPERGIDLRRRPALACSGTCVHAAVVVRYLGGIAAMLGQCLHARMIEKSLRTVMPLFF